MNKPFRNTILLSIVVISFLMHFKHFTKDLMSVHVWRQTETQSTINNFYEEDMNILNPRRNARGDTEGIFRMEFPLMQWLVACLYKIFGNHIVITRIFMFFVGILSILGIYKMLLTLFQNETIAVIGAWTFNFSPCFYYYTINPLPDNFALSCSIWGLALFFIWYKNQKLLTLLSSSLLLSIGALCKLPFIIYFIVPSVYFFRVIIKNGISLKIFIRVSAAFCFIVFPVAWYVTVIPNWYGNVVLKGMADNNDSFKILLSYYFHTLTTSLPELLLNYGSLLFFLFGFYFLFKRKSYKNPTFIVLLSLGLAVLAYYFFEANAIAKVHDYYLFPFYPILFIIVAYGAYYLLISKIKFIRVLTIFLLLILPFTCYLRMRVRWNPDSPGFNKDLLTFKLELRNVVPNDSLVIAGNDESNFIFLYYIDKKGWGFKKNNLTAEKLLSMISKGARYLYSDSRTIESDPNLTSYFDKLILEKGSVKVYRLKQPTTIKKQTALPFH